MSFSCRRIQIHTRLLEKYHKGRFNGPYLFLCSSLFWHFLFNRRRSVQPTLESRWWGLRCIFKGVLFFSISHSSEDHGKKNGCRSQRTTLIFFFFGYTNCVSFALALTRRPLYPARSEVDKLSLRLDFSVQVIICFPFACSHLKLLVLNRLTSL